MREGTTEFTERQVNKAQEEFTKGKRLVLESTDNALQSFRQEMVLWKELAEEQIAKGKSELGKLLPTIEDIQTRWDRMLQPINNAAESAQVKAGEAIESSGFGKFIDTVSTWANKIWDGLKPHLAKIAKLPGLSWIIGPEYAKMLEASVSNDIETEKLFEEINKRVNATEVAFVGNVNDSLNLTSFNDSFEKLKTVKGTTYTKTNLFIELKDNEGLMDTLPVQNGKKILTMKEIAEAAATYAKKAVATLPVKPPEKKEIKPVTLTESGGKITAVCEGKTLIISLQPNGTLDVTGKGTWQIIGNNMPLIIHTLGKGDPDPLIGSVKNPKKLLNPFAKDEPELISFSLTKEQVFEVFEKIDKAENYRFKDKEGHEMEFKKIG